MVADNNVFDGSWDKRMELMLGGKLDESRPTKYWDGVMSAESKHERTLTWDEIDKKTESLLADGYRIVKYSAITPKGSFSLNSTGTSAQANASNMFFELNFNKSEFEQLYDLFGRYQNNFPDYFKEKEDFEKYCSTHDIWVLEDIKTKGPSQPIPVGFSTFCFDDTKEGREEFNVPEGQRLLYHDTIAIDRQVQGRQVGMRFSDIVDGYYLQYFGAEKICYGLCTGEINSNDKGALSKGFHEKRGFGNWIEASAPLKKWIDRYKSVQKKYDKKAPPVVQFMLNTYRGRS